MQAVEQEVRIDLRPQRPQLGLARLDLCLERAAYGRLALVHGGDGVVDRAHRHEDERHADRRRRRHPGEQGVGRRRCERDRPEPP